MFVEGRQQQISDRLEHSRVIGIVRLRGADLVLEAATIAANRGLRAVEVPYTVPDTATVIAELRRTLSDDVLVGAGTVRNRRQLDEAVNAGADFIVAPGLDRTLVVAARAAGILMIPGVYTATEVQSALDLGVRILKLFPAQPAGPTYMAALLQPFPAAKFVPTGGVGPENAMAFFTSGASAVAMGSSIFPAERIDREGIQVVASLTDSALGAVRLTTA